VNAACLEGVSPFDFAEIPVLDGIHHPADGGIRGKKVGTLRFAPEVSAIRHSTVFVLGQDGSTATE
jgi:hypothetical protein